MLQDMPSEHYYQSITP